jgi:hypothetical protein
VIVERFIILANNFQQSMYQLNSSRNIEDEVLILIEGMRVSYRDNLN